MRFLIVLLVLSTFIISCESKSNQTDSQDEWKLLYSNNNLGENIYGQKEDLISAIRNGNPIRIAWASRRRSDSTKTVEHVVDGEFLTIANGQEVFAQIKPFMAQRPDLTSDTLSMTLLSNQVYWILGTNGTISSVEKNFKRDTVFVNEPSNFRYKISWFSKSIKGNNKSIPLWLSN